MGVWERLKKQPERWSFWALVLLFAASMLPVLYLSRYAVPACDDFTYGQQTYQAWRATGSFGEVLRAALLVTADTWQNWQGTWSSVFLMTLQPGIFGDRWYFITTLLMAGMLCSSVAALTLTVLKLYVSPGDAESTGGAGSGENAERAKRRRAAGGSCVLVLLFVAIQTLVSPVLGLYWYNGALHYVFMESVLFFQAAAVLALARRRGAARLVLLAVSTLLGACLGGANLLTALQSAILICLFVLYEFRKKRPGRFLLLLPLFASLAGFAANVLAPGNLIREDTAQGMGPVAAIGMSFYWGAVYVTEWLTPLALAGFALLLPAIWRLVKDSEAAFFPPVRAALLSYCVFSAMFTPTLFATSSEGPDRCKNVMRIVLYLLVFFNLVNVLGRAARRRESFGSRLMELIESRAAVWMLAALLAMTAIFLLPADKNTYTSISAVRSLASGEAAQYYAENEERTALYESGERELSILPLTVHPHLLYIDDVTNEGGRGYWLNLALMEYYGLDRITVQETQPAEEAAQ
ncbi:MAG: DUF6056 family protein [Eubacteriales bacterium]|nr:DUF6056 family protein [Eubacteriales bacterium]